MSEKVISVVSSGDTKKIYYDGKYIGSFDAKTDADIAEVVEACLDECIERAKRRFEVKVQPLLIEAFKQMFRLGQCSANGVYTSRQRDSLWHDIVNSVKFW